MLIYDLNKNLCLMHKEICVQMVKDTDNVISWIVLYGPPKPECISWKPYQGNVPYDERIVHRKRGNHIAVRLHYNNEILIGRFDLGQNKVKTVSLVKGPIMVQTAPDSAMEFLVVSDLRCCKGTAHCRKSDFPKDSGGRAKCGWRAPFCCYPLDDECCQEEKNSLWLLWPWIAVRFCTQLESSIEFQCKYHGEKLRYRIQM